MNKKSVSQIVNHLAEPRNEYYGAVSPPIFQSTNFCFENVEDMGNALKNESEVSFYTRGHNPTTATLRAKLAALENAEDALIFASGSAAVAAAIFHFVKQGDHIICVQKPYSWTAKLLNNMLSQFGVESTFVNGTLIENFKKAIKPNTRLIFLETPNSWTFELQDIEAVCEIAKVHNIGTIIDNSYCTPLYQQPLTMGVDIVIHSASKYIGGHSDVVAGVLCASKEITEKIFTSSFMTLGGIISPNDAWLLIRGLRTLEIRLERVSQTTERVVAFLENHPKIEKVLYPFSKSFPQYELAKKQMKGSGGMFSIVLKTEDTEKIKSFCNALKTFILACSWGGHESIAFPAITLYESGNYHNNVLPHNMIRMYCGLESPDELIEDLETSLGQI
jgi:cystathionine beta-lyase/cystathionine gamma-synthase